MKILYRFSDGGYNKLKPEYVVKRSVLLHFLNVFEKHEIYIFADNIYDDTYEFIKKYVHPLHIIRTSLSNAKSFMNCVDYAINNFDENEKIYFAEDDYLYTKEASYVIEEGLEIADYSSGYDHPDKYINHSEGGPNPFIEHGGELSRVLLTKSKHWKFTNSCCMTFATTVKTIKEDYDIFSRHCTTDHPHDFYIFCDLNTYKSRKLVSCIPAVSTHGETMWLSKLIDWEKEFYSSFNEE